MNWEILRARALTRRAMPLDDKVRRARTEVHQEALGRELVIVGGNDGRCIYCRRVSAAKIAKTH